jgi:hypothetical protein
MHNNEKNMDLNHIFDYICRRKVHLCIRAKKFILIITHYLNISL